MSASAWFTLGVAVGIDLTFALFALLHHLEARTRQYVRAPGAATVTRVRFTEVADEDELEW